MLQHIKVYGIALVVFFSIDIVWLGLIARGFYQKHIGFLLKENTNWFAAILFYSLFIGGLVFFVINPAIAKNSWSYALLAGGFFGMITYATYDMTNLATLKNWPVLVTIVDIIWGTVLNALTAVTSYHLYKMFVK